jgi:hypothetical protein
MNDAESLRTIGIVDLVIDPCFSFNDAFPTHAVEVGYWDESE